MSFDVPAAKHSPFPTSVVTETPAAPKTKTVQVWDLPLRLFHWMLVGLVVTAGVTGMIGGDAMELHLLAGYGIAALVVFRLIWGVIGTTHARFSNFVRGLSAGITYARQLLRGEAPHRPGHNPLGGWMIVLMLLLLAIQIGSGLFANDDILTEGPLFAMVSKATSDSLSALHRLNFTVLAGFIGLHVLAVGFYLVVKRINLIRPMITGRMICHQPCQRCVAAGACDGTALNLRAAMLFTLIAGALYFLLMA